MPQKYIFSVSYDALSGLNPLVATDAICFMPWIAAEYGLRLEENYDDMIRNRPSCFAGTGDKTDINKEICWYE